MLQICSTTTRKISNNFEALQRARALHNVILGGCTVVFTVHVFTSAPEDYEGVQRNLALELVRVTEAAALSAGHHFGRGDKNLADQAAVDSMRKV